MERTMAESKLTDEQVAATLAEIRAKVQARRARLSSEESVALGSRAFNLTELRKAVDELNDHWFVSAHLPMTWDTPLVGRLGSYTKRVVRILLRWYINPIVEQQNRFNAVTARAAVELNAYAELLTRQQAELEERIAALEQGLGRTES